ncbi:MAG: alkaline phosphatase [Hyphomonadaceae bacterium]
MSAKLTRRGALGALGATAAAACTQEVETPAYDGVLAFNHGIASGDPREDRVIIWTRVTPERQGPVPVRWILARNRELTDIVKTGVADAVEARDYTVKADVFGLRPGAPYFYGFRAGDQQSPVGKTKTLPRGRVESAKLAVVSCSSFSHGFFNAYEALAQRDDVDLIVHLGDYIYEYGLSGYGGDVALTLGRVPQPEVELRTLQDYRQRHAQYKTEAELQAAHAAAAWISVWDDHETANNSFAVGAENHNEGEGEWADRKAAALQAYYEWMPIREPEAGRALESINRAYRYGDLFSLIMLETRLLARTRQLDYATEMPLKMTRWNFADQNAPVALREGEADTPAMRALPAIFENIGGQLRPVLDWRRVGPMLANPRALPAGFHYSADLQALDAMLNAPERALLGQAQEEWLAAELRTSAQSGAVWQVIGNQIMFAPVAAPDLSATPPALAAALEQLLPGVTQLLDLTREPIPLNTDGWDGYPAVRDRVLASMRAAQGNVIVVTGDTHTAWANEVSDDQGRVAIELGTTSITSPSEAEYFVAGGLDFGAALRARNPHVKYAEGLHRGYLLLTLARDQALAEFFQVTTITTKEFEETRAAAFAIAPAEGAAIGALAEA